MILLVENDTISRNVFARLLRAQGHQVVEVTDGQEALELLPKDNFDLVIADLVMPRVNGFELAAQIRRRWPVMPILLMSAYLSQDGGKIISDGVVEFIQKPIDPPALIATVQRLLQKPTAQSTVVASSTPKLYRRKQQSEVWHFSSNCSQWLGEDYVEQRQVPSTSEMCNECIVKWRTANSH